MLRVIAQLLTAVLLAAGLATATPTAPQASATEYKPYGRASAPSQTLGQGCRKYRLDYVVKPPTDQWSAIIRIYTPSGRKLTSVLLDANKPDPRRGTRKFTVCRSTVVPGRFKIGMTVVWNDFRDRHQALVKPTYFYMKRSR